MVFFILMEISDNKRQKRTSLAENENISNLKSASELFLEKLSFVRIIHVKFPLYTNRRFMTNPVTASSRRL